MVPDFSKILADIVIDLIAYHNKTGKGYLLNTIKKELIFKYKKKYLYIGELNFNTNFDLDNLDGAQYFSSGFNFLVNFAVDILSYISIVSIENDNEIIPNI